MNEQAYFAQFVGEDTQTDSVITDDASMVAFNRQVVDTWRQAHELPPRDWSWNNEQTCPDCERIKNA